MNSFKLISTMPCTDSSRNVNRISSFALTLLLPFVSPFSVHADGAAKSFSSPEAAVVALDQAVNTTNRAAWRELLGSASDELVNPDSVQGARELATFAAAFNATNRLERESDSRMILIVGVQAWPFPIPLMKRTNGWQFDTASGVEELLNRRVGKNELEALRTMRACVDAQREYASRDRDGDEVLEYAQKIASSPGQMDGLYWPPDLNGEISPLGPLVAEAQGEGYFKEVRPVKDGTQSSGGENFTVVTRQPFHGYFFVILTRQGKHAPGGKYDYIINGNMIGGFAFVAWPASHGDSGVMTFIVNQQGRVYQKDLGEHTAKVVEKIRAYDPDPSWRVSPD